MTTRRRRSPRLVAEARAHAAAGKAVLVICHEQCEAAFKGIPGVRTLHHGNYAGDDEPIRRAAATSEEMCDGTAQAPAVDRAV